MVFDDCPASVKQCDALDHRSNLTTTIIFIFDQRYAIFVSAAEKCSCYETGERRCGKKVIKHGLSFSDIANCQNGEQLMWNLRDNLPDTISTKIQGHVHVQREVQLVAIDSRVKFSWPNKSFETQLTYSLKSFTFGLLDNFRREAEAHSCLSGKRNYICIRHIFDCTF